MMDLDLLATVRMKELRREAELARSGWRVSGTRPAVSRSRIVLAQWLMAAAQRLWPEARPEMAGGAR